MLPLSSTPATRVRRPYRWAFGVLGVLYVVFCLHLPLSLNMYAVHDDAWFVFRAGELLSGNWLGAHDQFTLMKGPGFSYFLVFNKFLGTPLHLSLALLYLLACAVMVATLRRLLNWQDGLTFAVFAGLLWQPALMANRVIRDNFYHSLLLLILAAALIVAFDHGRRRTAAAVWGGLAFGWFWITREEGLWIVPTMLLIFGVGLWRQRRLSRRSTKRVPYLVFAVAASLPIVATSAMNAHEYGVFTVTDFNTGGFQAALTSLDRIEVTKDLRRVPVPPEALAAAYEVSPNMVRLRPYFDAVGPSWEKPTCENYPKLCGYIAGGWFSWVLRDAGASIHVFDTAAESDAFYRQISEDINSACDDGRLACHDVFPFVPTLRPRDFQYLTPSMFKGLVKTAYLTSEAPYNYSAGPDDQFADAVLLLRSPFLAPTPDSHVSYSTPWVSFREVLMKVYQFVTPPLAAAGFIACLWALTRWRQLPSRSRLGFMIAAAFWLTLLARLGVLAIVDVTAAPGMITQYLEPAFIALYLGATVSLAAAYEVWLDYQEANAGRRRRTDSGHHNGWSFASLGKMRGVFRWRRQP